jgi:hypothetical protein
VPIVTASCTLGASGIVWGGSDRVEHNVFAWFWAIAPGSPDDLTPADVAPALAMLGRDASEAPGILAKARRIFAANRCDNQRSGEYQRCELRTKATLLDDARRAGIRVSGWDTKHEIIRAIVDARYPRPKAEDYAP